MRSNESYIQKMSNVLPHNSSQNIYPFWFIRSLIYHISCVTVITFINLPSKLRIYVTYMRNVPYLDISWYVLTIITRAIKQYRRRAIKQYRRKFESSACAAPIFKCGAPSVRSRNSAVSAASCSGCLPRRTSREWSCAFSLKLKQREQKLSKIFIE